jgi:hypothetical protein
MSKIQKLKDAKLDDNTGVILRYEDGLDVIHCHDNYEQGAVGSTCIASYLSEMVINPSLKNNHIIQEMRESNLLDNYTRGSDEFEDFVSEVVAENWQEYGWLEASTEKYDHKRGFTTVSAFIETTVGSVSNMADFELSGWNIEVSHPLGSLTITD